MKSLSVAVLIDGGFFLKRYYKVYPGSRHHTPEQVAQKLYTLALAHVGEENLLYRVFYYDCQPLDKKAHNPISNRLINYGSTPLAEFRKGLFEELKKKRKVALRLGYLHENNSWVIRPRYTKQLLKKRISVDDLREDDVMLEMTQKGIDIKIGVDIASMAIKKNVDRIVLISGDSDFVPAAKLARREGMDFILDPMWNPIHDNLFEHIDGLKSTCPKPRST